MLMNAARPLLLVAGLAATATACATTPPAPTTTVRGQYVYMDGSHVLRPCGNATALWVVGDEDALEPLRTRSTAKSMAVGLPNQGVYAEVSGVLEPSDAVGYPQKLRATAADRLSDTLPETCAAG